MSARLRLLALLGGLLGLVLGLGLPYARTLTEHDVVAWPYVATAGWLLCLAAAAVLWPSGGRRADGRHLAVVLAGAAALRLVVALQPPALSSDLNRYLWDARVGAAGVSPYLLPPAAPELAPLRDSEVHPHLNRPESVTVYPPGAQLLFRGLRLAGVRGVTGLRLAMALIDVVAVALLALALARLGLPPARVVLYAWSPLAVSEHAGNAHLEAAVVLAVATTLLQWRQGRALLAGAALGAATLLKLYPAVLLAALRGRGERSLWLGWGATVAAGYALYLPAAGRRVLGFLPDYPGPAEDFNVGLRGLLEPLLAPLPGQPRTLAFAACAVALAAALVVLARRTAGRDDAEGRCRAALGWTLLLMPTAFHPWYATPLLALCCFAPRAGWLWLAGALPWAYTTYAAPGGRAPAWLRPLVFLPTWALLAAEHVLRRRRSAP